MSVIERLLTNLKRLVNPASPAPPAPSPEVAAPYERPPDDEFQATERPEDHLVPAERPEDQVVPAERSEEHLPPAPAPSRETESAVAALDPSEVEPEVPPVAEPADVPTPTKPGVGLILRLESERGTAPIYEVERSGATLGRGEENTIRLEDLSVSRKHARIAYRQGAYWLSDLGSMGGTWVDGTKLNAPRRVAGGQIIDIGVCRLTVAFVADDDNTARPKREPASPSRVRGARG